MNDTAFRCERAIAGAGSFPRTDLYRASVRGQEHVIRVDPVAKRRPPGTESAGLQHLGSHAPRQGSQPRRAAHQLPSQRAHRTLPLRQDDN